MTSGQMQLFDDYRGFGFHLIDLLICCSSIYIFCTHS